MFFKPKKRKTDGAGGQTFATQSMMGGAQTFPHDSPMRAKQEDALTRLLKDKEAELADILAAIAAGKQDVDVKIAAMLEGEPDHVRMALLKKVKEVMAEREAEKSRKIEQVREQEEKQQLELQRKSFRQWLSWIMAEDTIRRLRETFAMQPILEMKVKNIGLELAKKGVLTGINPQDRAELGGLSASIQQQKTQSQSQDKGRR